MDASGACLLVFAHVRYNASLHGHSVLATETGQANFVGGFMINLAISIGALLLVVLASTALKMYWFLSIPLGLAAGFAVFFFLSRKVQDELMMLVGLAQKELAQQKIDRAIEIFKQAFPLGKRQLFVTSQINSQIGQLYYLKKDDKTAKEYLQKGFARNVVPQCILAVIYHKEKDFAKAKEVMELTLKANKKESLVYGIYAYLLVQNKEHEKAKEILRNGYKMLPKDTKLETNLTQLENGKELKMKLWGEVWYQFMLERPPKIQQEPPPYMRVSKRAMFRGR